MSGCDPSPMLTKEDIVRARDTILSSVFRDQVGELTMWQALQREQALLRIFNGQREGAWYWPDIDYPVLHPRPEKVTLCGSTRFVEEFNNYRKWLSQAGIIVLSIEIVTSQAYEEDPQHVDRANKEMLDALHCEKIRMSDCIYVLNVGGYIGPSTQHEIDFATEHGKKIIYAF